MFNILFVKAKLERKQQEDTEKKKLIEELSSEIENFRKMLMEQKESKVG
ncbi:MAG: hypothetical protein QME61_00385 [Patescibacteria group bacterium]|nr:hypothetical protein [Patescibacteria group bacterium]